MNPLREMLAKELQRKELLTVASTAKLLKDGYLTSIEAVLAVSLIEKHFQVTIPDSAIQTETFTFVAVERFIKGETAIVQLASLNRSLFSRFAVDAIRRPVAMIAGFALSFFILGNLGPSLISNGSLMRFLEQGERFYPTSGALSHYDFTTAAKFHAVQNIDEGELNIAFLGNSGTFGTYVEAAESIPAHLQNNLPKALNSRVYNLTWFGEPLFKDLMILELVWDKPWQQVIFTVTENLFHSGWNADWMNRYPHCTFNRPLFERFAHRLKPSPALKTMRAGLAQGDTGQRGDYWRAFYHAFPLITYGPYLKDKLFGWVPTHPFWKERNEQPNRRFYLEPGRQRRIDTGIEQEYLDADVVSLLSQSIELLKARGVSVTLYLPPLGPKDFQRVPRPNSYSLKEIAAGIAAKTGAALVDSDGSLVANAFIDSAAHYTANGNRTVAKLLADRLSPLLHKRSRDLASTRAHR